MNVGILVVDAGPTLPICSGNGSLVRRETRRMIKRLLTPLAR
jgi:hypothetical protein